MKTEPSTVFLKENNPDQPIESKKPKFRHKKEACDFKTTRTWDKEDVCVQGMARTGKGS